MDHSSKATSRITYNKLVRDRIPEIIQQEGKAYETTILTEGEYEKALRNKVIEEATEVAKASTDELVKEIADLYEVLDALIHVNNIDEKIMKEVQKQRHLKRGGFEKHIQLLWVESDIQ
jgi:predicted house-cleaning noncanonical NTP pyrophosphatase (MazG superfamily)